MLGEPCLVDLRSRHDGCRFFSEASSGWRRLPSITVFAPIIERAFTILVHLFASVLVYAAVVNKSSRMFWLSFLCRGAIDAMVPGLGRLLAQSPKPVVMTYTIELVIVIYGLLGLLGVRWLRGNVGAPR